MAISDLFLSLLEREEAQERLKRMEDAFDVEGVKEFWENEGWRITTPKPLYKNRVPLWVLLDAYQLTFSHNLILFAMLNELEWYCADQDERADSGQIDAFIADTVNIFPYINQLKRQGMGESAIASSLEYGVKLDYQLLFAEIIRLETDKDAARRFMYEHDCPQKKEADGFLMREFARMEMEQGEPSTAMPNDTLDRRAATRVATAKVEEHIKGSGRHDWKKQEYLDVIAATYPDYIFKLAETAWADLPKTYKAGRGRPKKK